MPTSNFKLFDENKANMLTDSEYSSNAQRLNGVQSGVASSKLQNKFQYQASLVAYAIAQLMVQNGYDATDSTAVTTFVNNMSNTMLQKVIDKATTAQAEEGTNNIKWMTPALVKSEITKIAPLVPAILSNETKALYGLGTDAVPDDVLALLRYSSLDNIVMKKFLTSQNFVAPDNASGNEFLAIVVGGGGGGSAAGYSKRDSAGGGSGGITIGKIKLTPGETYPVVVGAGGSGGISTSKNMTSPGSDGGSSSFVGLTALGGGGATLDHGGDAAPNGGGGGGIAYGENAGLRGGNGGLYGGGGGAYGVYNSASSQQSGIGGNGGKYGGGGGGYITAGTGGEFGGNGGNSRLSETAEIGVEFGPETPFTYLDLFPYKVEPMAVSVAKGYCAGGGGYGSVGGEGETRSTSNSSVAGGGGGFCGNGGSALYGAGGGGGFCSSGGTGNTSYNSMVAAGGGGGFFADGGKAPGGKGSVGGAGGAGGHTGDSSSTRVRGGDGGNGLVILIWRRAEK